MNRAIGFGFVCALLMAPAWAQTAGQKLDEGARLIEDNCGECMDRRVSEFDRGVRLIEEALREGAKDRKKALLALAEAYSEYAYSYDKARPMSEETRAAWRKRVQSVYRELLRDEPGNADLIMNYANSLDPKSRPAVLLDAVRRLPEDAGLLASLAYVHLDAGDVKTAVGEFVRAVRMKPADPDLIESVLPRFYWGLSDQGDPQSQSEVTAAGFETLAALEKGGSAKAVLAAAILHVQFGQAKIGVEEFLRGVRMESADERTIEEKLEGIAMYLYRDPRGNAEYIGRVTAAAAEAMKARTEKRP